MEILIDGSNLLWSGGGVVLLCFVFGSLLLLSGDYFFSAEWGIVWSIV